jgi:ech hydrogenase subunit C
MPDPKVVVGLGVCTSSGGIFAEGYNVLGGIDQVVPVDVFVPGCPPRPEAIIDGLVKALEKLAAKGRGQEAPAAVKETITYNAPPRPAKEDKS